MRARDTQVAVHVQIFKGGVLVQLWIAAARVTSSYRLAIWTNQMLPCRDENHWSEWRLCRTVSDECRPNIPGDNLHIAISLVNDSLFGSLSVYTLVSVNSSSESFWFPLSQRFTSLLTVSTKYGVSAVLTIIRTDSMCHPAQCNSL